MPVVFEEDTTSPDHPDMIVNAFLLERERVFGSGEDDSVSPAYERYMDIRSESVQSYIRRNQSKAHYTRTIADSERFFLAIVGLKKLTEDMKKLSTKEI